MILRKEEKSEKHLHYFYFPLSTLERAMSCLNGIRCIIMKNAL